MGNSSVCTNNANRKFFHLSCEPKQMHMIDVPHGVASGMAKGNLGHQMRYSVELLEHELADAGQAHVLQLALEGDDLRNPVSWTLYADGLAAASGSGDYARECFYQSATSFMELCRAAVQAAGLASLDADEYRLLAAARKIAAIERAAAAAAAV